MPSQADIPRPSLARIPLYYRRLLRALEDGEEVISSQALGEAAHVPAAQVRKDLNHLGELGRAGIGYDVHEVAETLHDFLGLKHDKEAIVIGAGNIGRALAAYPGFERYGLRIVALFDNDPIKIGAKIAGKPVYSLRRLGQIVRESDVRMGIVAVPADMAQEVVDAMVAAGIEAIWNFAPRSVSVPSHVLLESEDLAARIATLSYHMSRKGLASRAANDDDDAEVLAVGQ